MLLFLSSFYQLKKPIFTTVLVAIFAIAFIVFLFDKNGGIWQWLAHAGLIGLIVLLFLSAKKVLSKEVSGSYEFWIVFGLFTMLAVEEVFTFHFQSPLFSQYYLNFPPLDIFPVLFTLVIGRRLAQDINKKAELELEVVQYELQEEKVKLQESERRRRERCRRTRFLCRAQGRPLRRTRGLYPDLQQQSSAGLGRKW